MAISNELSRKLSDSRSRDAAMLETARHYIDAPGVETDEMVQLFHDIPCLNDRVQAEVDEILLRVQLANGLLPQAKFIFSTSANFYEVPGKIEEQIDPTPAFNICHNIVYMAEHLAESTNAPVRETMAALARIGVEVAIHFILTSERPEVKRDAKGNLIYFALVEMLALGTKTSAYQYCFTNPEKVKPGYFIHSDDIRPIIALRPGADERNFKGSIVLGETSVEHLVVPEKGKEFFYLGGGDGSSSPDPQGGKE